MAAGTRSRERGSPVENRRLIYGIGIVVLVVVILIFLFN